MSVKCEFKKSNKFVNSLFSCFKYIFCIYKMYLISAEGYENAEVDTLTKKQLVQVLKTCLIQFQNKYMASVKQKKLTKEQIRKFKMTERKLHSRFSNSSEEELGKIKNKIIKTLMLEIMS